MSRKMVINAVDQEQVRIGILKDGILEDFDIETRDSEKNKGNIYKALVAAVEPSLNAAFVNYGADKHGFLTIQDVDPAKVGRSDGSRNYSITELLKPKQSILVQVEKDEVGTKGAVLTMHLSIAGRYLVLMPGGNHHGVSRKIEDEETRRRMREAADKLAVPKDMGVIIRTAGKDRAKGDLTRDLRVLTRLWDNIQREAAGAKAPSLILKEQDVVIRALRDYFTSDIDEVIVDSDDAYDRASEYMHLVMPKHRSVLTRYVERRPIFNHYGIEDQLQALFSRKVSLPSGGSLVLDPTEALVAIDVNSGKQKSGRQEDTAVQTNLEAAVEVARQLRLRDLGGIIVVDFIDMASRKHERQVEKTLRDALAPDKARVKLGHFSPNGTLELTRQRIRSALGQSVFVACSVCGGTGHVLSSDSHSLAVLRTLRDRAARGDLRRATVRVPADAGHHLRTEKWQAIQDLEHLYGIQITIAIDRGFSPGQHELSYETDPDAVVTELPPPNFGPPPSYLEQGDLDDEDLSDDIDEDLDEDLDEDVDDTTDAASEAAEDDEVMETEATPERGSRRRRRPRRDRRPEQGAPQGTSRGPRDRRSADDAPNELALPTFELVDMDAVASKSRHREAPEAARRDETQPRQRGKRRRRRGSRGAMASTSAVTTTAPAVAASVKPSWLKRLSGLFTRTGKTSTK